MCDQKSTEKLEAEICWAFFPHVSTVTENPNHIMRGKRVVILARLGLIPLLLSEKELVQSFLSPSLSVCRLSFDKLPQASSPFFIVSACLSPEALPESWSRIYAPASAPLGIQHSQAAKTTN